MPQKLARYRFAVLALLVLISSVFAYPYVTRLLTAKQFLTNLSTSEGHRNATALVEQDVTVPGKNGPIPARIYHRANTAPGQGIVVAHGIHYRGIDERRLVPFVRELARSGLVVLTPLLADLADYRLTRASVDVIADSVVYLAQQKDLILAPRVGLLGFSFAGGLSLVAASESKAKSHLNYVVNVGGHHDLDRVFRFLISNEIETPSGMVKGKAHDYGLAVLLYGNLAYFVPEAEQEHLRNTLRAWLHEDRPTAMRLSKELTGRSAELFQLVEQQKLGSIAPQLRAAVEQNRSNLSPLSPKGRLKSVEVPVYLLHGAHDSVIPPSEADFAGLELGKKPHSVLVTPLIEHVEVSRNSKFTDQVALVQFMSHLF